MSNCPVDGGHSDQAEIEPIPEGMASGDNSSLHGQGTANLPQTSVPTETLKPVSCEELEIPEQRTGDGNKIEACEKRRSSTDNLPGDLARLAPGHLADLPADVATCDPMDEGTVLMSGDTAEEVAQGGASAEKDGGSPNRALETDGAKSNSETVGVQDGNGMPDERADDTAEPDADESWQTMSTSTGSEDSEASDGEIRGSAALEAALEEVKAKVEHIMAKPKPIHTWSLVKELHKRQRGERPSLLQQDQFRLHMYSSLHAVQRLELMAKLCRHQGCVNCLSWNASGDRLASGSDDLNVVVWDWQRQQFLLSYDSGHKSNIFEAKFVPLHNNTQIVTTSRDGQVRLADISPDSACRSIRCVAQHRGSGRKLALQTDSPHHVLSCGEDAVVFNIDLREQRPQVLTTCTDNGKRVPSNSIAAHPEDGNVFLLSCVDKFVRLYDRRMMGSDRPPYRRLCPHRLLDSGYRYSVTCGVFNYNGTRIVASYNDEDIYMFDTSHSDGADAVRQYSGHRNNATIKGVNFFGPTSQYVVSGSDCGNIIFWDADTEAIVQCMPGDEHGVVNCLEPHPHIPVLATSGLDDDVKVWVPSRDEPPDLKTLRQTVETNLRDRLEEDSTSVDSLGGSIMWTLMQQLLSSGGRRLRTLNTDSDDADSRSSNSDADQPGDCRPS